MRGDQLTRQKRRIDTLYRASTEAEAVRLFTHTYLAVQFFFNEFDSCAMGNALDTASIIEEACIYDLIGGGCNTHCFVTAASVPEATIQALANYN